MWFPSRNVFLELTLEYKHNSVVDLPRIYCSSDQAVELDTHVDKNIQHIKCNIDIPEVFYVDIKGSATIKEIKLDKFDINQNNLTSVFKIIPNTSKKPFNKETVDQLPIKEGLQIYTDSFLIFNLYENDSISYLLSIGNKIQW